MSTPKSGRPVDPGFEYEAPGKVVSVSVAYSYHPFYPFNNVTLPLSSSAQMVISY